jgi:hypothetical protein
VPKARKVPSPVPPFRFFGYRTSQGEKRRTPEAHLVIGHFERGHPNTSILDGDAGEEEFAYRKRGQGRTFAYRRELYRETCAYEGPLRGFRGGWNIFDIAGPFFTLPAWLASCVSNTRERFTT